VSGYTYSSMATYTYLDIGSFFCALKPVNWLIVHRKGPGIAQLAVRCKAHGSIIGRGNNFSLLHSVQDPPGLVYNGYGGYNFTPPYILKVCGLIN
jgi:hypothetical protein